MTQKILYIDDNWYNCDLVRRILIHRGFECVTKMNGSDGINYAIDSLPSLILTDIHMSPITGIEVFTVLRNVVSLNATPIVAITADNSSSTRNLCAQTGFDGFYGKPILRKELDEIIQKYISNRLNSAEQS